MNRRYILLPLCLAFAACTAPAVVASPRPLTMAADSAEYAPYFNSGPNDLAGQAFLTTRGGDVKLAAGRTVTLDPLTKYSREWFRRWGGDPDRFLAAPPDSLFLKARRTTTANAEGRFRFTDLPAGEYIVRTVVTWETGSRSAGIQGGVVATVARVGSVRPQELILNQVYEPSVAATLGVAIIDDSQLGSRPFRLVASIKGVSCQENPGDPGPTREKAEADLIVKAANQEADAVAHVTCKRHGISIRPDCMSRIECQGDAIAWIVGL